MKRSVVSAVAVVLSVSSIAASRAEAPNQMKQCAIGLVAYKVSFSLKSKGCYLAVDEGKLKANLEVLGWSAKQPPKVDWAKEVAVVDVGDIPYAHAVPACDGVFAEAGKAPVAKWKWREEVPPSASAALENKPAPAKDDRSMTQQAKDQFANLPKEAVEKGKAIGEDFKNFPALPKRYAVVMTFPKELVAKSTNLRCKVEK